LDLVVKDAVIVTSAGSGRADLGVRDGRVAAVGSGLGTAAEVIEAGELHLVPGLIDVHVHFREPGLTYKEDFGSGSLAAACGGVTTVHDMPNTPPVVASGEILRAKRALVEPKAWVDFGLYGVILPDNEAELDGLAEAGAMGYKLYLGETTGNNPTPDDGAIYAAMRRIARRGLIVGVHAENNPILQRLRRDLRAQGRTDPRAHLESRPAFVEAEAVERAATLAEAAGCRVHIHHLSTRDGLERVVAARRRGARITCEVLVSHLALDDAAYARYGNLVKVNPPLREPEHVAALWDGLRAGLIDCIATDHAPHSAEEQALESVWEAHGGWIGVETMLPLLLTDVAAGRLSLEQMVRLTSENPARLYGHWPRKGSLQVGADADFVLVDLAARYRLDQTKLHSKHPVTPFDGWELTGRPVATYLRGTCVAREGEPVGAQRGRFLQST
jgi:allantoinase